MIDKKRILSRLSLMQEYINEIEQMLDELDEKSNNNKPKIGEIARYELTKLLAQRVWSPQEFASFFDERYCKDMFDIDFALLTQGSKFDENGYSRYYKRPISVNGRSCYLCSQWYERSRGKLLAFIEKYEE